jgi:hypothetical protein
MRRSFCGLPGRRSLLAAPTLLNLLRPTEFPKTLLGKRMVMRTPSSFNIALHDDRRIQPVPFNVESQLSAIRTFFRTPADPT